MRPRNKEHIAIENRLDHHEDEKRERNENVVRDFLNDIPIVDMIAKHRISYNRIKQILEKYKWVGAK